MENGDERSVEIQIWGSSSNVGAFSSVVKRAFPRVFGRIRPSVNFKRRGRNRKQRQIVTSGTVPVNSSVSRLSKEEGRSGRRDELKRATHAPANTSLHSAPYVS